MLGPFSCFHLVDWLLIRSLLFLFPSHYVGDVEFMKWMWEDFCGLWYIMRVVLGSGMCIKTLSHVAGKMFRFGKRWKFISYLSVYEFEDLHIHHAEFLSLLLLIHCFRWQFHMVDCKPNVWDRFTDRQGSIGDGELIKSVTACEMIVVLYTLRDGE